MSGWLTLNPVTDPIRFVRILCLWRFFVLVKIEGSNYEGNLPFSGGGGVGKSNLSMRYSSNWKKKSTNFCSHFIYSILINSKKIAGRYIQGSTFTFMVAFMFLICYVLAIHKLWIMERKSRVWSKVCPNNLLVSPKLNFEIRKPTTQQLRILMWKRLS